ncbi:flagellar protein [Bacillus timonensis]|nr:flagellar protein [Bacillus timonensis]
MNHKIHSFQTNPLTLGSHPINKNKVASPTKNFGDILHQVQNSPLKISKHAKQRLNDRDITISPLKWNQIEQLIVEARKKGIRDSLVVTGDAALIVNTQSNTVITALNREEANSQIFTNINGTILLD